MIALPTSDDIAEVARNDAVLNATRRGATEEFSCRARHWLVRLEWLGVILVALYAIALHIRFVTSVGGLWRDEANSVNLAILPSFAQIWSLLEYDSFPIVFVIVLRGWTAIFGSGDDTALRAFGLLTGLGVIGVLFLNARSFGARAPVLSLALIGLNPMLIRYGDSVRGYGLGILLILLTFGSFWQLVSLPPPLPFRRILTATILALLSVHCLFYNSVLLFAIAAGALAVTVRARAWRTAGIVLGIGVMSGSSLLVYAPMMTRKEDWTFMVSYPVDLAWLWKRTSEVIGSPDPLGIWLWLSLLVVGLSVVAGFAVLHLRRGLASRRFRDTSAEDKRIASLPDAVLFAVVALIVGVVGYAVFLRMLQYYTQPWYYITLLAFVACALDVVFGSWPIIARSWTLPVFLRSGRLMAAFALLCLTGLPDWNEMPVRHTNVDLIAARLRPLAAADDLILVPRWECAISLSRYYRGPAEIVSLPPIEDHRFHRYDLVLRQMMTPDPTRPILTRMEETLRSGHRVFIAGMLPFPDADYSLPSLSPAYRNPDGSWNSGPHSKVWRLQAGQFLRTHATGGGQIDVPVPGNARVQGHENLELGVAQGWQ